METNSQKISIQPGAFACRTEGGFVQYVVEQASYNYPGSALFSLMSFLDQFLPKAGAHEFIISGDDNSLVSQIITRPLTYLGDIDHTFCNI